MPTITRLKDIKKKNVNKQINQSQKYYNSKVWRTLRNSFIKTHPLCERCLEKGIVKEAEEIHHKIPFLSGRTDVERWKLLSGEDNLMSLCCKCHNEIHNLLRIKRIE